MNRVTMLTNADIRKVDLVPAGAQQLSKIEIMIYYFQITEYGARNSRLN